MNKVVLVLIFHLILQLNLNAQSSEDFINCYDSFGYCLKTKINNGIHNVSLVDTKGNVILDRGFDYLSYTSKKNYFKIKSQEGLGIVNIKGDTIVPPRFKNVHISGSIIIVRNERKKFLVYNTNKELVINEEQDLISPKLNDFLWAKKDELWQLFNSKGELMVPIKLLEYEAFNISSDIVDLAWKAKSVDNNYYLISVHGSDIQYDIYHDIYQPPRNFNCKVFSELPNGNGEVLKFATFGYGTKKTPSKYIEICFNPECLEKFRSIISIDKIPKRMSTDAIGVLPNYDVELIDSDPDLKYFKVTNLKSN